MSLLDAPRDELFWAKVDRQPGNGCWLWTGSRTGRGYGQLGRRKNGLQRRVDAHRYSWELHFGPIPAGLHVCHRCDEPLCVRPDHLFLGSHSDNMRDMYAKGRALSQQHPERVARGERQGSAKLTEEAVQSIREKRAAGALLRELAAEFGMGISQIARICRGQSWAHI